MPSFGAASLSASLASKNGNANDGKILTSTTQNYAKQSAQQRGGGALGISLAATVDSALRTVAPSTVSSSAGDLVKRTNASTCKARRH